MCKPAGPLLGCDVDTTLTDLCNAGEGGADGNILGVCGGVLPDDTLPMLLVDDFLLGFLKSCVRNNIYIFFPLARLFLVILRDIVSDIVSMKNISTFLYFTS